ncbi:hypothetical protein [Celeribacter sp. ULVN23_4]
MDFITTIFAIVAIILGLYAGYLLYVRLPMDMAEARSRDPASWLLMSIFCSPFVAIFFLWLLGDASE